MAATSTSSDRQTDRLYLRPARTKKRINKHNLRGRQQHEWPAVVAARFLPLIKFISSEGEKTADLLPLDLASRPNSIGQACIVRFEIRMCVISRMEMAPRPKASEVYPAAKFASVGNQTANFKLQSAATYVGLEEDLRSSLTEWPFGAGPAVACIIDASSSGPRIVCWKCLFMQDIGLSRGRDSI